MDIFGSFFTARECNYFETARAELLFPINGMRWKEGTINICQMSVPQLSTNISDSVLALEYNNSPVSQFPFEERERRSRFVDVEDIRDTRDLFRVKRLSLAAKLVHVFIFCCVSLINDTTQMRKTRVTTVFAREDEIPTSLPWSTPTAMIAKIFWHII